MISLSRSARLAIVVGSTVSGCIAPAAPRATPGQSHPLDPLSAREIETASDVIRRSGRIAEHTVFVLIESREPEKAAVLRGESLPREAFVVLYDRVANQTSEAVVDLGTQAIASLRVIEGAQPLVLIGEFDAVPAMVQGDARVQAALRKRGITDFAHVQVDLWAGGERSADGLPAGARYGRAILFYIGDGKLGYGRPIEGLVVIVNLNTVAVAHVHDYGVVPLSPSSHDITDAGVRGPPRAPVLPLDTVQPSGPSFTIAGNEIRWQKWRFRFANRQREGIVLHQVGYEDGGRVRSILYRASLSEMVVPYGDPSPAWVWRAAFDEGEYGLGQLANPLELGVDVPAHALLLDSVFATNSGQSYQAVRTVAIYERDGGLLWKHLDDYGSGEAEARRGRELVLHTVVTVGNYDYGIKWVFTQDAQIAVEVELTGMLLTKGTEALECERCVLERDASTRTVEPTGTDRFGTVVAANLLAPNHQHFFNFRLDFDVDGTTNTVRETNVRAAPEDSDNAFLAEDTILARESDAARDLDLVRHRRWTVFNPGATSPLGHLAGFTLEPGDSGVPYVSANSRLRRKASFLDHHVWVTQFRASERHGGGDYPNQSLGGDGLASFVGDDQNLIATDVVLWYTLGVTHIPRPEEWPIMSVARTGFRLMPNGFFARNPAVDVPVR